MPLLFRTPISLLFVSRLLLIVLFSAGFSAAAGTSVTVAWNANPETDIAGYRVGYGAISGQLTESVVTGTNPTAAIAGLEPGKTYFCAVQAFNSSAIYSAASAEISFVAPTTTTPSQPEISIEQPAGSGLTDGDSSVNFGNANLGSPGSPYTFTIRNSGTAPLNGIAITADGSQPGDFVVSPPSATTLTAGTSATFQISFRPTAAGTRTAAVHVASNDADENPFDILLTGTGVAIPDISISQSGGGNLSGPLASVNLGSVNLGSTGATQSFIINNIGTANLTNISLTLDGANASNFIIEFPASASLVPGASTTFRVTFQPTAAGTRTATLHVASNDPDQNPFNIVLSGTGISLPEIAVTKSDATNLDDGSGVLGFGSAAVGSPSPQTLTITNLGTANLTGLAASIDGVRATEYRIGALATTVLAPGASTTLQVSFTPAAIGIRSAALHISSNDADENPFDIILTGRGFGVPEIAVATSDGTDLTAGKAPLSFGNVNLGDVSEVRTFTIQNRGSADLTGLGITVDGANAGDFSIVAPAATTLSSGAGTSFQVSFRPSASGLRSATLHLASNDADENPFDIALSGSGDAFPVLSLQDSGGKTIAPGSTGFTFDGVVVGTMGTPATFVVKNTGTAPLTGLQLSAIGPQASSFVIAAPPVTTLAPGASTSFTVAFKPDTGGKKSAAIRIHTGFINQAPLDLGLIGNGIALPEIAVDQETGRLTSGKSLIGFGSAELGSKSAAKTLTIRNLGTSPLTGLAIASSASDFKTSALPASTLAAGASMSFKVTFSPTAAGTRAGQISISSNDPDEGPFTIAVKGTGNASPEIEVLQANGKKLKDDGAFIVFGTVKNGSSSKAQTITIRNTGTAALEKLSLTRGGVNDSDFTVTALKVKSLAPGASTTLKVTFKPHQKGTRWGALHIHSNDADEGSFDIVLTGTGGSSSKSAAVKMAALSISPAPAAKAVAGIEVIDGRKYRTLTITRAPQSGVVPSDVEVSSDLLNWSSGARHTTVLLDDSTILKVRDNTPVTPDDKRYIRLKHPGRE